MNELKAFTIQKPTASSREMKRLEKRRWKIEKIRLVKWGTLGLAFGLGFLTNHTLNEKYPSSKIQKKPVQVVHEINQPANLDILQRRGKEEDLHYLPNQKLPFSGYAASSYTNGQKELLAQFKNGKLIFAQGWKFNGEQYFKSRKRDWFIMETDDPEVGFYYENGIEIAYRGKKDSGKPYHHFYRDGAVVSYHDNGIKKKKSFR